ncbi:unnamed protein product, partial [Polarella glacialis]
EGKFNFDEPAAVDLPLMAEHLSRFRDGQEVEIPEYSHALNDGLYVLRHDLVRSQLDLKIFIDVNTDACLARRISRDKRERCRTEESVAAQWESTVLPGFEAFIRPSRLRADIIVKNTDDAEMSGRHLATCVQRKIFAIVIAVPEEYMFLANFANSKHQGGSPVARDAQTLANAGLRQGEDGKTVHHVLLAAACSEAAAKLHGCDTQALANLWRTRGTVSSPNQASLAAIAAPGCQGVAGQTTQGLANLVQAFAALQAFNRLAMGPVC